MTNIYSKRNNKMKESIKQTNEAINEFLGNSVVGINKEECVDPLTGKIENVS